MLRNGACVFGGTTPTAQPEVDPVSANHLLQQQGFGLPMLPAQSFSSALVKIEQEANKKMPEESQAGFYPCISGCFRNCG